ncbi:MAG: hypothetical protein GX259_02165 [Bacteroidales bacterium]|nr:hypothetical protein [Bacteroidales bacterium]
MKIKLNFIFIIALFFLISCKKENNKICRAGVFNRDMVYYNFNCDTISNYKAFDLNRDGKDDFCIAADSVHTNNGHDFKSTISILDNSFEFAITEDFISPIIIGYYDVINDDNYIWSNKPQAPLDFFKLVRDCDVQETGMHEVYNYWFYKTGGYIGIRQYSNKKYKYGWLNIRVIDYNKVIVFDCAFTK